METATGIAAIGAGALAAKKAVDGIGAFLGRLLLPAADEGGAMLKDIVSDWRRRNVERMAERAKKDIPEKVYAHPRIVHMIVDHSSWVDDSVVQDLWGGLLASSCTDSGQDESNLVFIKKLKNLSAVQARILKLVCENARLFVTASGLLMPSPFHVSASKLIEVTGIDDLHRLNTELADMCDEGLLEGGSGFHRQDTKIVFFLPTPLAFYLYVRCQGSRKSPNEYFNLPKPTTAEDLDKEIMEK